MFHARRVPCNQRNRLFSLTRKALTLVATFSLILAAVIVPQTAVAYSCATYESYSGYSDFPQKGMPTLCEELGTATLPSGVTMVGSTQDLVYSAGTGAESEGITSTGNNVNVPALSVETEISGYETTNGVEAQFIGPTNQGGCSNCSSYTKTSNACCWDILNSDSAYSTHTIQYDTSGDKVTYYTQVTAP